jgi:hypothetical protein
MIDDPRVRRGPDASFKSKRKAMEGTVASIAAALAGAMAPITGTAWLAGTSAITPAQAEFARQEEIIKERNA